MKDEVGGSRVYTHINHISNGPMLGNGHNNCR